LVKHLSIYLKNLFVFLFAGRSRTKRHDRRNAYNMEMLLTADSEIVQFHGSEHVEKYLLTLINIVSNESVTFKLL